MVDGVTGEQRNERKSLVQHAVTAARRVSAAVAILLVVVAVARSYVLKDICREQAASDAGRVTLCGPVGLEDVPAIGVLLLVGAILLLPDMSEVGIPGLITLKRAVEKQSEETKALADEVSALSLTVRQNTTVNNYMYPPDPGEALKGVQGRERELDDKTLRQVADERGAAAATEAAPLGPPDTGVSAPSAERARVESEILRLWQALEPVLPRPGPRKMTGDGEPYDPRHPSLVVSVLQENWSFIYRREIDAFRAIRNTVAHAPGNLTDDQVLEGRNLGRELLASYRRRVEELT